MKKHTVSSSEREKQAELKKQIVHLKAGIKKVIEVCNQWKSANKAVSARQVAKCPGYIALFIKPETI